MNAKSLHDIGSPLKESDVCAVSMCSDTFETGFGVTLLLPLVPYQRELRRFLLNPKTDSLSNCDIKIVCGTWTPIEQIKSSTWREMESAKRVLYSAVRLL